MDMSTNPSLCPQRQPNHGSDIHHVHRPNIRRDDVGYTPGTTNIGQSPELTFFLPCDNTRSLTAFKTFQNINRLGLCAYYFRL